MITLLETYFVYYMIWNSASDHAVELVIWWYFHCNFDSILRVLGVQSRFVQLATKPIAQWSLLSLTIGHCSYRRLQEWHSNCSKLIMSHMRVRMLNKQYFGEWEYYQMYSNLHIHVSSYCHDTDFQDHALIPWKFLWRTMFVTSEAVRDFCRNFDLRKYLHIILSPHLQHHDWISKSHSLWSSLVNLSNNKIMPSFRALSA